MLGREGGDKGEEGRGRVKEDKEGKGEKGRGSDRELGLLHSKKKKKKG